MKKTLALAAVVVGVHCVAITALFLVQGCKTTKGTTTPSSSSTPVMPPLSAPAVAPATVEPAPILGQETKGETIEYTVQSGDSIGAIAKKHNVSRAELMALNKLADPNKIRVGQKLIIPKYAHAAVPPVPKTAAKHGKDKTDKADKAKPEAKTPSLAAGVNEYVVQAGDSLSKIAAKLNVKISELREVNKLVNDKLRAGQKLVIPGATKVEGAPAAPAPAASEPPASPSPAKMEAPAVNASSVAAPAVTGAVSSAAASKNVSSGITHVVLPNEDLSSIAKLYAVTVDDLVAANQLGANRTVQPGQKIIIP